MGITDFQSLAIGAGGAGLVFSLAGLLIRSLFRAAKNDEEYRKELKERDEARAVELTERKKEWEQDRKAWQESEQTLRQRLYELEAKVSAQEILIGQLTAQLGAR